ncbi:MAG: DUF2304 domain-containing protein [Candidatus Kerfeldbacteria bacterium]|nr:DUF2304 domain-containing protein [Candidatus Kerfeldbacteria bacterium]
MSLIQFIILAAVAIIWWRLYARLRSGELTWLEFVEWFALWLGVAVIVLVPEVASYLAAWVGVGRGSDLVVYLALLLVFYLLFKIFIRQEKLARQLTSVVRGLALKEASPPPAPSRGSKPEVRP